MYINNADKQQKSNKNHKNSKVHIVHTKIPQKMKTYKHCIHKNTIKILYTQKYLKR